MAGAASFSPIINSTAPHLSSRKRKRTEKTVRFDVEHTIIIDTYSPLDYDRGSIFSFPIQYRINPNILAASANEKKSNTPSLSLEIPLPPSSPCDSEASSPDIEQNQLLPSNDKKKKKPKLTVNTSVCSGDGPLFFTKLSTNYIRHRINNDNDEGDDTINGYLIPITPTTPF
jgi:hypothetical protein